MTLPDTTPSNPTTSRTSSMPLLAKMLLVLTTGLNHQNFLGQAWLAHLMSLVPAPYRRQVALQLLGLSPHYFIYQWTAQYPDQMPRLAVLEAEHRRNKQSRQALFETVLRPHLDASLSVMDFGCGPGYLARATAQHVERVIGVDISSGALACARVLNDHENIDYVQSEEQSIRAVDDASVDLIYSFAVVQHMRDPAVESIAEEWLRTLKSGGRLICHAALQPDSGAASPNAPAEDASPLDLRSRYALRMRYRTKDEVRTLLHRCGFEDVAFTFFEGQTELDDDVAHDPLVVATKP